MASRQLKIAGSGITRTMIATVHLVVLLVFLATEFAFSLLHSSPPQTVILVAAFGILLRLLDVGYASLYPFPTVRVERLIAWLSILLALSLPLMLAVTAHQPHTHYFGMLILPILEAALYFSFLSTVTVAGIASSISAFWVAYTAHFQPPFEIGELLEAATLILVCFVVAVMVWWLVDILSQREAELEQRITDLKQTRSRMVEGEKLAAIGRLASAVAHEIRNPVAIISSALEIAASQQYSTADREEMSRVAVMEARRLEKLTTDFLSYAQPGIGALVEVDAGALAGYIASIVRAQALNKGIAIKLAIRTDCRIYGNEGQMQQVLLNLMRNAVEASPSGSCIKIDVGSHNNSKVRISLQNAGPKIPENVAGQMFEPFFTAKVGGTGLGLAIARSIVEKHGGELLLESNDADHIVFAAILPSLDKKLTQQGPTF